MGHHQLFNSSSALAFHTHGGVETDVGLSSLGIADYVHMSQHKPVFGQLLQASPNSLLALGALFSFFFCLLFLYFAVESKPP